MTSILRILACFIVVTSSNASHAQTFTWARSVVSVDSAAEIPPTAVITDHHYYTIFTGSYNNTIRFDTFLLTAKSHTVDEYLTKYDSTGNVIWAINILGKSIYPKSIAVDKNDNIYICGYFYGNVNFTTTDSLVSSVPYAANSFLAKYDSSGKFQWATTDYTSGEAFSVTVDPFNNVIWAGYYNDSANFGGIRPAKTSSGANTFIAKYTSLGSIIWVKTNITSSSAATMIVNGLSTDYLGNIYATGYISGVNIFDTITLHDPTNVKEIFIAKFDSSGTMLWGIPEQNNPTKNYYGNQGSSIGVDRNGNAYICGYFWDTSNSSTEGFIEKYSTTGAKQWTVNLGRGSFFATGLSLDTNGYPYIIGDYIGTLNIGSTVFTSPSYCNTFVAKFDTTGNNLWAQNSIGYIFGSGISVDQNTGNISIIGYFTDTATLGKLVMITNLASTYPVPYVAYISNPVKPIYTNVGAVDSFASAVIYPNPATNQLFIKHAAINTAVTLFNISGQSIYNTTVSSDNQPVNISGLAKGIYLLQLTGLDGNKQTARIVKE